MTTNKELDLVFCCDCTGSMGSYIQSAKENIQKIVQDIVAMEKCDVRFALIQYRDHPPQDQTFASKSSGFTGSVSKMRDFVNTMAAEGGGDGPESVTDALWDALNIDYRKTAAKVVVIISDAPPHGLGESGDGFPNGCPCGHDPLDVARKMAERGIVVYAVGVEPTLSSFKFARDFMRSLAKITEGQFLPLSAAHLLPKVVVGGAIEEISMQELMKDIEKEVSELQKQGVKEEEVKEKVKSRMKERKIETNQLKVDSVYEGSLDDENVDIMMKSESLSSARGMKEKSVKLKSAAPAPMDRAVERRSERAVRSAPAPEKKERKGSFLGSIGKAIFGSKETDEKKEEKEREESEVMYDADEVGYSPSYSSSAAPVQEAEYTKSAITDEQVEKLYSRGKKMNLY